MAFLRRWLLVGCVLLLGGGPAFAASQREVRAFAAAQSAFQMEMWNRAESQFAEFVQRYPESPNVPRAILYQAQAEYKQGDFTNAVSVLALNQAKAGQLADQYVRWIGDAQFAKGDFDAAANTYELLTGEFTNSPLRMFAAVSAAASRAQLGQWDRVGALLEPTNSVFQTGLRAEPDNPIALRGQLLRAQARFAHKDYAGAASILEAKKIDILPPAVGWPWVYLLCQTRNALGDLTGALSATTNLLQIANVAHNDDWLAESVSFRADLLERLQMSNDAITTYQQNLVNSNAPAEMQRQAILKIAQLSATQNQYANAESTLNNFLVQFPNAPASDVALYSLGELHLKHYMVDQSMTNLLLAKACLDQFLSAYTNSQYIGNAYLNRGWCNWFLAKYPDSATDFNAAVGFLPHSLDQAVAHFKLGDSQFMQNDYSNALVNYHIVVNNYLDVPGAVQDLDERALYQSLRASEAMNDYNDARDALSRILKMYPNGSLSDNATLHFGEFVAERGRPGDARDLFRQFVKQFPQSELLPQVELAIARTYEQEGDWAAANTNYSQWLSTFPTNELRAQAVYANALASYHAGNETNALAQFVGFLNVFPTTNELAPRAQWWIADYFYRQSNFAVAETNYENIFQNPAWRNSQLYYQAQYMAGLSAMGRDGYSDAATHFSSLISDANCPPDLGVRARFACASAWQQLPSSDTNNPGANFATAISYLTQIVQMNPTNDATARAWGQIGDCDFQIRNYDAAMSAYTQVFSSNSVCYFSADVSARSAAQVSLGMVYEKRAEQATGGDQTNLLQQALNQYLDVFDTNLGDHLRPGEVADPFWIKKAGLQALPLIEALGVGNPNKFIDQMEVILPAMKAPLEKIRQNLAVKK